MRSLAWLGIVVACVAPATARADELLPTTVLRPVRMLDVDPASSLAATVDNGWVTTGVDDSHDKDSVWVGGVEVSGELALADHVKLFASQPFAYTMAGSDHAGLGNLTLGTVLLGANGPLTGALSFSYSRAGETSAAFGELLRAEHTHFWTHSDVLHGGIDGRWRGSRAVLQVAVGLTSLVEEDRGRQYLVAGRAGVAFPTASGPTFFVEAGVEASTAVRDADGRTSRDGGAARADLGLRGRIGEAGQTFALAVSGLAMHDVTSLTLAFELRSDFGAVF
jgi:hypothetical protein